MHFAVPGAVADVGDRNADNCSADFTHEQIEHFLGTKSVGLHGFHGGFHRVGFALVNGQFADQFKRGRQIALFAFSDDGRFHVAILRFMA